MVIVVSIAAMVMLSAHLFNKRKTVVAKKNR